MNPVAETQHRHRGCRWGRGSCATQITRRERGQGSRRAQGACCYGAAGPSCVPRSGTPGGALLMGQCHLPSMSHFTEPSTSQLSSVFRSSRPGQMKSLVCSSDMLSQYFPAVDLVIGFYFCQTINGFGNCCYFTLWDTGLNICQTGALLFRLCHLNREYINAAEAVKIHSSIIICLVFEKCILWNYFLSKRRISVSVSVFYNDYIWARRRFWKLRIFSLKKNIK